jgi:hypothetical protein
MSLSPVSDSSGEETVSEGGHEMSMSPVSDNGLSSSDSSGLEDNNASIPEDPALRCTQFETRNNLSRSGVFQSFGEPTSIGNIPLTTAVKCSGLKHKTWKRVAKERSNLMVLFNGSTKSKVTQKTVLLYWVRVKGTKPRWDGVVYQDGNGIKLISSSWVADVQETFCNASDWMLAKELLPSFEEIILEERLMSHAKSTAGKKGSRSFSKSRKSHPPTTPSCETDPKFDPVPPKAKVNSQRPHVSATERAELAIAREEARDLEQARIVLAKELATERARRKAAEKKLLLHQTTFVELPDQHPGNGNTVSLYSTVIMNIPDLTDISYSEFIDTVGA